MKLEDFKNISIGLINDALANMHTIAIAKVTQVKEKTINCKPVMSRIVNGQKIDLPEFPDIPCINLQGGSSYLHMPTQVGDYCLLLISERCFDGWYNGQDFEKPLEYRMHDYSDSFAIIGINPAGSALTIPTVITMIGDAFFQGNHVHEGNTNHTGDYTQEGNKVQTGNHTQTGNMSIVGAFQQAGGGGTPATFQSDLQTEGELSAVDFKAGGNSGVSGTFTSNDGKTITVTKGIITAIV